MRDDFFEKMVGDVCQKVRAIGVSHDRCSTETIDDGLRRLDGVVLEAKNKARAIVEETFASLTPPETQALMMSFLVARLTAEGGTIEYQEDKG